MIKTDRMWKKCRFGGGGGVFYGKWAWGGLALSIKSLTEKVNENHTVNTLQYICNFSTVRQFLII